MSKKNHIIITLVVVMLAVVLTFEVTFVTSELKYQRKLDEFSVALSEQYEVYDTLLTKYQTLFEVDAAFRERYIGEIDDKELMDYVMLGYIVGTGDKYANYFNKEEFEELIADTEGDLVGIGVLVIETDGYIEIINVMPDSPALEAGIQPGDLIVEVGGESVAELGYQLSVNRMLGEEGTVAEFAVLREGERIEYAIKRALVSEQSVLSRFYEPDPTVGVVKVLSFNAKTPAQFKAACEELIAGGATRLVFDVRYNPGGELASICSVLDYLLPAGPIVRIVDGEGNEEVKNSAEGELDVPMAVLVNGSTASAAELFSSALQDYKKATLVGTVTYGKGTVQGVVRLSDGSGFTVSHSMYYPPFSDCYEGVGVIPDVEVELDEKLASKNVYKITDAEDNQLARAVEVLNEKVKAAA